MPPIFGLIQERGGVSDEEMYDVFNMGCGFCVVVAARRRGGGAGAAAGHYPAAQRIGRADRRATQSAASLIRARVAHAAGWIAGAANLYRS